MPTFRHRQVPATSAPLEAAQVREVIADVMRPAHFFAGLTIGLQWQEATEVTPWEIYQGRLLNSAQCGQRRTFEAWHVFRLGSEGLSDEPLLALRYDAEAGEVHITRAVYSYVTEGYDAGGSVFLSRQTRRWLRELVGTLKLSDFANAEELGDEIICRLFHAVVGASRLPLTSVEAPLPDFSLGELSYCYRLDVASGEGPMRSFRDLVEKAWSEGVAHSERVKLLELVLRATPAGDLDAAADVFIARLRTLGQQVDIARLLRDLLNDVALSPYSDFVGKMFRFLEVLVCRGGLSRGGNVDFLSYLLRQLGRHLTAYDLVTFHHRGANYPDALLMDEALKAYLRLIERDPVLLLPSAGDGPADSCRKRIRRRALRQALYFRRHYEGHPVPDMPTSPGENARVLPPPFERVPEEQILDPTQRTRRLFADDPLDATVGEQGKRVLEASMDDLGHPEELRELGTATFLDRPLGTFKRPCEPDATPLLSYEAFSRSVARQRLDELAERWKLITEAARQNFQRRLDELTVEGVRPPASSARPRPGSVSLGDAHRVAPDFVILRTTDRSAREFWGLFDWSPLDAKVPLDFLKGQVIIARSQGEAAVTVYENPSRPFLRLEFDPGKGYAVRGGVEYPAAGLTAVGIGRLPNDSGPPEVKIPVRP
jgi:hypothetical protein